MNNTERTISLIVFSVFLLLFLSCATVTETTKSGYYTVKHTAKGWYYLDLDNKKYKEGIAAFGEELQANPNDAEANYYMGRLLLADNRSKEAQGYLEKAATLAPQKADYHFWLGLAYNANGKKDHELRSYQKTLEIDPHHVQALTYTGHIQLEKGEHEKALKTYSKVIELDRDNPAALYNKALCLNRLKRSAEERQAWKQYLSMYSYAPMGRQAAIHLNDLGDFQYRNYLIGSRTITLESIRFEPGSAEIQKSSCASLDALGDILANNRKVSVHIIAYQKKNSKLAEARAKNVKSYILTNYREMESSRLMLSWFGVPEEIKTEKKAFKEDESINFITAVEERRSATFKKERGGP